MKDELSELSDILTHLQQVEIHLQEMNSEQLDDSLQRIEVIIIIRSLKNLNSNLFLRSINNYILQLIKKNKEKVEKQLK